MNIKLVSPFLAKKYPITQGFGENPGSYVKFGLSGHNGIDYGCPTGSLIYSSSDGTVTKTGFDPEGYGNFVRVSTTWGRVIYAHLSEVCCSTGQFVRSGDFIGRSGNTGNSTGPHLHFEVRLNGHEANGYSGAVDPTEYFIVAMTPAINVPATETTTVLPVVLPDTPVLGECNLTSEAYTVTSAIGLNVRSIPSTDGSLLFRLDDGQKINAVTMQATNGDIWLGFVVWCAQWYQGDELARKV